MKPVQEKGPVGECHGGGGEKSTWEEKGTKGYVLRRPKKVTLRLRRRCPGVTLIKQGPEAGHKKNGKNGRAQGGAKKKASGVGGEG